MHKKAVWIVQIGETQVEPASAIAFSSREKVFEGAAENASYYLKDEIEGIDFGDDGVPENVTEFFDAFNLKRYEESLSGWSMLVSDFPNLPSIGVNKSVLN